jgi:transcription elongation factor GreB
MGRWLPNSAWLPRSAHDSLLRALLSSATSPLVITSLLKVALCGSDCKPNAVLSTTMTQSAKRPMTLAGYRQLNNELDQLVRVERPRVVTGVTNAAAEGDRSENAEYIYGKKRLREIDKRANYLGSLLKDVEVIDPSHLSGTRVTVGATVVFSEDNKHTRRYMLVGEGESDTAQGSISYKSPVGMALMGKQEGDVVTVIRPAGEAELEVVEIWFGNRRCG